MKKPKPGWEHLCEHANEVPNVCPCPPTCGCRYYHCAGKAMTVSIANDISGLEPMLRDSGNPVTVRDSIVGPSKPITFKIDFRSPEQKMADGIKVGQNFHIFIPVSETHEVRVYCRVTSKRKVRVK